jgi:hypothetical protein
VPLSPSTAANSATLSLPVLPVPLLDLRLKTPVHSGSVLEAVVRLGDRIEAGLRDDLAAPV